MFWHLFVYRLKCLLRNGGLVFWTMLFPLFMATLFFLGFGGMITSQSFEPVSAAVVDNAAYRENAGLRQLLSALAEPGEQQLLNLTVVDQEQAAKMLEQGEVAGVILASEQGASLEVRESGIGQSVLKAILDDYAQTTSTVMSILRQDPTAANELLVALRQRLKYTELTSFSTAEPHTALICFYALIANTCLFGGSWGLLNSIHTQADLSEQGIRRSVAPTHKLLVVLSDTLAALLITYAEVLILLAYLGLVLGVQFGTEVGYILLVCLLGSLTGVAWGTAFGTLFRKSEGVKTALLTVTNLTLSFLAGMMVPGIKLVVDRAIPMLSYVNPVTLISDAFYSLYIFAGHERFFLNVGVLGLIAAVLTVISFLGLRSERYASL